MRFSLALRLRILARGAAQQLKSCGRLCHSRGAAVLVLSAVFAAAPLRAEVRFSELDLSTDNRLLFKATTDAPVTGTYDTLFLSNLQDGRMQQLTFFPEQVLLAGDDLALQIQNRFGVYRTDRDLASLTPVETFPAFVNGAEIQTGKLNSAAASPDGRYLLLLRAVSYAYADLVLHDAETGNEVVVSRELENSLSGVPVAWSGDADFFVYAKGGTVYYYSLDQLLENRVVAEEFRAIGRGGISNVRWAENNDLYLISKSLVYRVKSAEFFTRSLYSKLMNIGSVVGKLPFDFDPSFDAFWISPDGKKVILAKGGRNVFLIFLQQDDYLSTGGTQSLPYLYLPRNTRARDVLWSPTDRILLIAARIESGVSKTALFRLDLSEPKDAYYFQPTDDTGVVRVALNGDYRKAALLTGDQVIIRDFDTWTEEVSLSHPSPMHVLWRSNDELIVAGELYTEVYDLDAGTARVVALSQPETYGYVKADGRPFAGVRDRMFAFDQNGGMEAVTDIEAAEPGVASSAFRVYLEESALGSYRNMIMVRNIDKFGTEKLFDFPERSYEPFPERAEPVSFTNFSHGSRIRRREAALVFNAIDNVEGLTEVLNTLAEYNLRCTFFVNGEFIRRHPGAVREIADSGHEVGSLFFAYFNMTDAAFEIDKEFIKQGLARNEDDYFLATGKELSLVWHAPYYFTSTDIIDASREMNYTYVGRDVDALDWVPASDPTMQAYYMPSASLIERIIRLKKPGSIIPLRIGETMPRRDDYLFHRLDVLIDALVDLGYSIVPVSVLMDHAK